MSMQWHADPDAVSRYASDQLDEARMSSLEAHFLACGRCRALLSPLADAGALERVWSEIEEAIDAPRPGVVERALLRFGVPDHLSRLLAATPSLRLSWFAAVAVALAFAVLAAHGGHPGLVMFLAMAPLIPVAGVAAAFGPGIDPTYEIGVAAPLRSFTQLLIRSAAVLVVSLVLIGVAALTFFAVLTLAGGQDVIAEQMRVSVTNVTLALRIMLVAAPIVAAAITWKWCHDLQAGDEPTHGHVEPGDGKGGGVSG